MLNALVSSTTMTATSTTQMSSAYSRLCVWPFMMAAIPKSSEMFHANALKWPSSSL